MTPKELAQHHGAKTFESAEAAAEAGFVATTTMAPRNVWNKASAAQAIIADLIGKRKRGEAAEIGLVIENRSVTGCYLPVSEQAAS